MALAPIGILYLASMSRMVYLQVGDRPEVAPVRVEAKVVLPAARGSILDRNGLVLAEDVTSWDLVINYRMADRSLIALMGAERLSPREAKEKIHILANGLQVPFRDMWNALMVNPSSAQVIRKGLGPSDRESVARTLSMVPHSGLNLVQNYRRVYPNDRVLSHMIGLQGAKNEKDEGASAGSGLELGLESLLAGSDGVRHSIAVSGENGVNPALGMEQPVHGLSVKTTLDIELSTFARAELGELMEEFEPVNCYAITVDVKSGQILSMLGVPDYDANDPVNSMELTVSPFNGEEGLSGWTYPGKWRIAPGSTVKPLMAAYALERNAIQPDQWFDDFNGSYVPPHRLRRDDINNSIGTPIGPMRAHEGIVFSSNIVFAQIARAIGREGMADFGDFYGFHKESHFLDGLSLRFQGGTLKSRSAFMEERGPDALAYLIPSMGYGVNFTVPPLDHAMALASIANGGLLHAPSLDPRVEPNPKRILSEETTKYVRTAMHEMAHLEKRKWLPHRDRFNYCGKSGTAELKAGPLAGKYTSVFCAFGPYEDPEVLVLVVAFGTTKTDSYGSTHFGSKVSGKAAVNILAHALESRGSLATKPPETLDFKASGASLQRDE